MSDEEECQCKVLVVGFSGGGKSSLANKLMGRADVTPSTPEGNLAEEDQPSGGFMVSQGFDTVTKKSQFQTSSLRRNGCTMQLKVVDTPGLFSSGDETKTKAEIRRGFSLCCPGGPHVVLVVMPLDRFTEQQERSFDELFQLFGKKVERHLIVVFTHGENLKEKSMEDVLAQNPVKGLRKVQEVVGTRYVVTSSVPARRESEMDALMDMILQVKASCGGQPLAPTEAYGNTALVFGAAALAIAGLAALVLKWYPKAKME